MKYKYSLLLLLLLSYSDTNALSVVQKDSYDSEQVHEKSNEDEELRTPVVIYKSGKSISGAYMALQVHKFDRDPTYTIYITAFETDRGKHYDMKVLSKSLYRAREPKMIDHYCCRMCERLDVNPRYEQLQLLSVEAATNKGSKP